MKYLKNLILSFKEIFIMFILQYGMLFISFVLFGEDKSIIIGSILIAIIQIIYIIFKFKYNKIVIRRNILFPYILLGIGTTTTYNMIILGLNLGNNINVNINILFNIIISGIIGPVFEEVLFRYSFINSLKKFNSDKLVIFISSFIFAICHTGITTCIYAFIIGIINSYLYIKKDNILIPIIIHVTANVFVNILYSFNLYIFITGIFLVILSTIIIKKSNN